MKDQFYQYMLKKHLIKCYSFKYDLIKLKLSKKKRNYTSKPIAQLPTERPQCTGPAAPWEVGMVSGPQATRQEKKNMFHYKY